jgi:hypothetical protein
MTVTGHLPAEIILRIVRKNQSRFRACYEDGLRKKADLRGRVVVNFTIGPAGDVSAAADGGSDLPDGSVVHCVVSSFETLYFPKPESGSVSVVYPVVLSPS